MFSPTLVAMGAEVITSHPICQSIIRKIYPFGSTRQIFRGPARGLQYQVEPGIGFSFAMATDGTYSKSLVQWVKPGGTVFDVGANRGQMALCFSRMVGTSGRVISFEPVASLMASTSHNIELNQIRNVHLIEAALSDSDGVAEFHFDNLQCTQGTLVPGNGRRSIPEDSRMQVKTLRLDTFMSSREADQCSPTFMKVDVEGAAGAVFCGAKETLNRYRPVLYVELHDPDERCEVASALADCNYLPQTIDGRSVETDPVNWPSPLVFIPG